MYDELDTQIYTTAIFVCPKLWPDYYERHEIDGQISFGIKNRVSDDARNITIAELCIRITEESDG